MKGKQMVTILLIGFAAVFSGCKKNPTAASATISISSPSDNDTIPYGQEVHIEGVIQGDGVLNGYKFSMKDLTTGSYVISEKTVDDKKESYVFHEHWDNNLSDTSTLEINVTVMLDQKGLAETKKINVVCLPQ